MGMLDGMMGEVVKKYSAQERLAMCEDGEGAWSVCGGEGVQCAGSGKYVMGICKNGDDKGGRDRDTGAGL